MANRKIAFICPSKSWGGLEMNVLRLSIWLKKRGIDIILYCDAGYELALEAKSYGIERRQLEYVSKFKDLLKVKRLASSFDRENVGLVLFHINKNFPMLSLIKQLNSSSFSLLYMQHMHLGGSKNDFFHRYIYKQLDCWITPLEMFSKQILRTTSIPKEKIEVIPFGIELDKFTKCTLTKSEARQSLKLPEDKYIVGFVGRLDPKKCQHLLIEAASKLIQKGIEIHVLLVGDSTKNEEIVYKKRLEDMIENFNLQQHVHFRSHLDNVEVAFKSLDIFCLTTGSETFGMVTIEAMASRLAVLGSNDGGTKEIIEHEKNGLLYQSGNSDEIAAAIEKLLLNHELKERLAKQAFVDAQQKYSHKVQCDALEKCFDRLI